MDKIRSLITDNSDLAIITLLGTVLRLRIITRDDFWYDEAFTGLLMKVPYKEFLQIIKNDPHPPAYSYLIRVWSIIFGVNDISLRGVSILFGILTIVLVFKAAKSLFNKDAAVIASFLAAINPFLVEYSVEARSYSFYGFMTILTIYLISSKKYILAVISTVILITTHYMALLFAPMIMIYFLISALNLSKASINRTEISNLINKADKLGLVTWIILVAIILLFTRDARTKAKESVLNIDWVREANIYNVPRSTTAYTYGVKVKETGGDSLNTLNFRLSTETLGSTFFVALMVGTLITTIASIKNPEGLGKYILVISLIFIPQLMLIYYTKHYEKNIYVERYLFPAAIFYLMSFGYLLSKLLRFETMSLLLIFYVFTLLKIQPPDYNNGLKQISQVFGNYNNEVVTTTPIDFVVARYYFERSENVDKLKLYDPNHADWDYSWWPFIEKSDQPNDLSTSIIVSPHEMPENFIQTETQKDFGKFKIYTTN